MSWLRVSFTRRMRDWSWVSDNGAWYIHCLIYKCEKILKIRISAISLFFILNCSIHAHETEKKPVKKIKNSSCNN